jgi:hypothetical protein
MSVVIVMMLIVFAFASMANNLMVAYLGLFQYTTQEKYAKVIDPITLILCRIEYLRGATTSG